MNLRQVLLAVVLAMVLAIAPLAGQEPAPPPAPAPSPSPSPGPGAGPSPGPSPIPTPTPTPTIPTQPGRPGQPSPTERLPFPEMQRPIYLSGKVVMEDGTPPPEPVTMERVCNGIARPEGYTDSKGRFSFELGRNMGVMPDASVGSDTGIGGFGTERSATTDVSGPMGRRGITERDLMGCEIRATLPGFRSDAVQLANRRMLDNPDVGTIILRRLGKVEGFTFSATSALAPKDAKKAIEKGDGLVRKKKIAEAEKEYAKAVQLYPKYAEGWHKLGRMQQMQQNVAEARKSFETAVASDPKYVNPYLELMVIQGRENQWEQVAKTTDTAIKLNPFDFPQLYFYNAIAYLNTRNLEAAEKSAREAKKADPNNRIPKVDHVLGLILAQKGDFAEAGNLLRSYLAAAPGASDIETVKKQLSEIDRLQAAKAGAPPPNQ